MRLKVDIDDYRTAHAGERPHGYGVWVFELDGYATLAHTGFYRTGKLRALRHAKFIRSKSIRLRPGSSPLGKPRVEFEDAR
jgi:hypothetical protein